MLEQFTLTDTKRDVDLFTLSCVIYIRLSMSRSLKCIVGNFQITISINNSLNNNMEFSMYVCLLDICVTKIVNKIWLKGYCLCDFNDILLSLSLEVVVLSNNFILNYYFLGKRKNIFILAKMKILKSCFFLLALN